jgi:uncharacterized protein (DUF58 family)
MLTRKGAAVAVSAILAVTLGLIFQNQYLVALSAPLTLFLALARLIGTLPHVNVEVERFSNGLSIYEDETQVFTVKVKNNGKSLDFVEILDVLPLELSLKTGSNHQFTSLQADQSFEFTYEVSPKVLGFYTIGPIRFRSMDIYGLYVEEKTTEVFTDLKVFPKIQYVSRINVRPRRTRSWPGEIASRKPGSGLEFYSIREYTFGDSLKRINWRASARFDNLMTNQFMSELGGDTIIALDARSVSEVGIPPDSTVTYSIRVAAIVAYRLLRDRNRVGMIVIGDSLDKVYPGFGRRQFDRILISLTKTRPGSTWEIGNLAGYLSLFFSRMTQIIVITPLIDQKAFEAVADIAARGYQVLVISPSYIEIEERSVPNRTIDKVAADLVRLERQTKITLLRRHAVVVDWNVDQPLSQALQEATFLWAKVKAR